MAHKNYNKISKLTDSPAVEPEVNENVEVTEPAVVEEVAPAPVEVKAPVVEKKFGIVTNCSRLNVRSKASTNSDVVCVINTGTEVEITGDRDNSEFYKVRSVDKANHFTGFCMKKFITIKQ